MPSSILDAGFAILWKTIKFVFASGLTAPVVSFFALLFATAIFITFVFTALNMVFLIVSQWFLLYGGIFFLGFGGLPSESDKAKNYLYLSLSIGSQLFVMAGIVGVGQSFIEAIYAQLSGDTSLGELAVILCVALVIYKLANEIPRMFSQFVPGAYSQHGYGGAAVLGGLVALGAAFTAATAMAKSAAANVAGVMRAASAAHSAAKAQSQSHFTARSQTGVSAAGSGGSIGPAGGGAGARAQTHTQGPFASMLVSSGIGPAPANGAHKPGSGARADTNTPGTRPNADKPTTPASQSIQESGSDSASAARTPPKTSASATTTLSDSASQPTDAPPRGLTDVDEQAAAREPDGDATGTLPDNGDTQSTGERADSPLSDGESATASARPAEADGTNAPSSESSNARVETSPVTHDATSNTVADGSDNAAGPAVTPASSTSTQKTVGAALGSAAASTQTSAASVGPASSTPTAVHAPESATAATVPSSSSPASASTSAAQQMATSTSDHAGAGSAPAATSTSEPSTLSAASNAKGGGSSSAAPAPSASAGGSVSVNSSPGTPSTASSPDPVGATPGDGAQRSSTAIGGSGTILAAAKILGEYAVHHQRDRLQRAKAAFWAEADQTTGGQIAKAIRKNHGLDNAPTDSAPDPAACEIDSPSDTTNAAHSSADDLAPAQAGPKHPADWVTGDEPMTDKQWALLELKLGDQFDPNLTKAEAAILIDEILNED
jgi:P-type conjugative transfer protein TrbL